MLRGAAVGGRYRYWQVGEGRDRWDVAHRDEYATEERLAMAEQQIGLFRALPGRAAWYRSPAFWWRMDGC